MTFRLLIGDAAEQLRSVESDSVQTCVTSPPYWGLRDYGNPAQIGHEPTPAEYVEKLVAVFREVRRVLREDGTLWVNLGDSYAGACGGAQGKNGAFAGRSIAGQRERSKTTVVDGLKPKDLIGIPWRVAFALQADGWWLRQEVIWHKPNAMPEPVEDRCTKAHESVFLLAKSANYYWDHAANQEPAAHPEGAGNTTNNGVAEYEAGDESFRTRVGLANIGPRETRNRRDVWTLPTQPFRGAHFATMAPELARRCVLLTSQGGGLVLDPFAGAGTTALVALQEGRRFVGVELNPEYAAIAEKRIAGEQVGLGLGGAA